MARRRRKQDSSGMILAVLILGLAVVVLWNPVVLAVLVLLAASWLWRRWNGWNRTRARGLAEVDRMRGREFERYVAVLLRRRGYATEVRPSSGDHGVDVGAQRAGLRYAVQTKRYAGSVDRTAVSYAVA